MLKPRNIVATVNLDCRLDLKTIALHARNAEYSKYQRSQRHWDGTLTLPQTPSVLPLSSCVFVNPRQLP